MQLYSVFVTFTYIYSKKIYGIDISIALTIYFPDMSWPAKKNRYMPEVDENRAGGLKAFSMKKMKEMGKSA